MLIKLAEYAEQRMSLPPTMYTENIVSWIINLNCEGRFISWECLRNPQSQTNKKGLKMISPHISKSNGIKPKLLVENGEYVLGIAKEKTKDLKKLQQRLESFIELTKACADDTRQSEVKAIYHFLTSEEIEKCKQNLPKDFGADDLITFRVGEVIPADVRSGLVNIQTFWADRNADLEGEKMTCLVTGQERIVVKRLPKKVKKLKGGQSSGTTLVSFNAGAFMSYGLKNSFNAPICLTAAENFTEALNSLIDDKTSRVIIGKTTYVYWTREKVDNALWSLVNQPDPTAIQNLLTSAKKGEQALAVHEEKQVNQFYALGLTAYTSRVVVRDWLETTLPEIEESLCLWFTNQRIIDLQTGEIGLPLSVKSLAESIFRDPEKEMQATIPTALMRTALHGDRLPEEIMHKLLRRTRAEHEVSYDRAVLIKLFFSSNPNLKEMMNDMEQLNPTPNLDGEDRSAYACGRLFATLESIQRVAIKSANATITDRYYGAVSTTPDYVFPALLKLARSHLSKLRKNNQGTYIALEQQLEQITLQIPQFPIKLNLRQQGLFSLGYYHQKAASRNAVKSNKQTAPVPENNAQQLSLLS
jgi:CRISPR-associated protein Csd1